LANIANALGRNLSEITGTNNRRQAIADLVGWAAREGRLTELLTAAEAQNSSGSFILTALASQITATPKHQISIELHEGDAAKPQSVMYTEEGDDWLLNPKSALK